MAALCGRLKMIGDRGEFRSNHVTNDLGITPSGGVVKASHNIVIVFGSGTWTDLKIDDEIHADLKAVSGQLAAEIVEAPVGEQVCFFYYKHLLRRRRLVGYRSATGESASMPFAGLLAGLVWYVALYPIGLGILFGLLGGTLLGALAGRQGSAVGLMLGGLGAIGVCWFTAFQFAKAYGEARGRRSA